MKIFSEIYGCYYNIIYRLLSDYRKISDKDISDIINEKGFGESMLFLLPKLKDDEWNLFGEARPEFSMPLTDYQKAWLKTILMDKRIGLFLTDEERDGMLEKLSAVESLFEQDDIYATDIFLDGDDYENDTYRETFRSVVDAIKNHEVLDIEYSQAPGKRLRHYYIPCRIEYSIKNDCIRVYCIEKKKTGKLQLINLGKIKEVKHTGQFIPEDEWPDIDEIMDRSYLDEPVTVLIKQERNALERFMLQFANYKKNTSRYVEKRNDGFDGSENPIYKCEILYSSDNETELLINILSFGPVVKVIGSERFLNQLRERLKMQKCRFT